MFVWVIAGRRSVRGPAGRRGRLARRVRYVAGVSARRATDGRRAWTVAAWCAIAALAVIGIALNDVSIAIGVGVAAVWALCFGFFPRSAADRP